ncbi:hypothetical protein JR316_0007760 [Psilocybe cubensis]|uniref:Uncharacterized protein n=2 Tax=Psilocybe cubensis TaxID=181762 RepID=A0ACB8GUN6_PSICU|nr:hypothetical protein JR316_0007760 [Psilocybe cubensis]KAH9479174.1 hypothetical protein JR316_0007760 [Psilocybe cubensis]
MQVEIVLDEKKLPGIDKLMTEILTLLDVCVSRLCRFDLRLEDIPISVLSGFSQLASRATYLQQLSLCNVSSRRTSFDLAEGGDYSSLCNITSLSRLRFTGLSLPFNPHLVSLDVRDLQLTYSDLQTIFGVECRLRNLVLYGLRPIHPSPQSPSRPIQVKSLKTIALSINAAIASVDSTYPFSFLDMPNVTYLEMDCSASLTAIFGKSLASANIDTLKFTNHLPRLVAPPHTVENHEEIQFLQSFSSLRKLELTHVPAKFLLSKFTTNSSPSRREVTRQRSIGSHMLQASRVDYRAHNITVEPLEETVATWPNLAFIRLDTAIAEDVVSLISFIQCHRSVRTIELSTSAMRHLSFLKRKGDTVSTSPPDILFRLNRRRTLEGDEGSTEDVKEWLSSIVDLKTAAPTNNLLSNGGSGLLSRLP